MTSGLVLLDKPSGITSHDLVSRLRKALGTKKIGHAGTLDPMATGLMILGVNQGTKLMQFLSGLDKTYEARITLGSSTTTDDAEGEVTYSSDASNLSAEQIESEIAKLRGEILQVPSSVSAISVDGKRAYQLVREGQAVELPSRKVTVSRFERTSGLQPHDHKLSFDAVVDCSSGTYIRALARDLGVALNNGGHLSALRRTRIGPFEIAAAGASPDSAVIIPLAKAAAMILPTLEVDETTARDLGHGKRVVDDVSETTAVIHGGQLVAILESSGKILVGFPQETNA